MIDPPDGLAAALADRYRLEREHGFATDDRRFYLTLGSHESDVWVLGLEQR